MCYTTKEERAYVDRGDYSDYYKTACAGGDTTACFDGRVAANEGFWAHLATNRLLDALRTKAVEEKACLVDEEGILESIRKQLAKRYADYLPDNPRDARWPSANDVAHYHWEVFARYGLPSSTFGGTPFGKMTIFASRWCPNCQP